MKKTTEHPLLLFDGVCNLCNGSVQFIIERDKQAFFRFASLQSDTGQTHLRKLNLPTEEFDSFILFENGKYYYRSTAALKVYSRLDCIFWKSTRIFFLVPTFIRDGVYNWVARNRYKWFGKEDKCMMPSPDLKSRFVPNYYKEHGR